VTGEREMNWVWTIGSPLVRALLALVFRVTVEGVEHVPRRGPAILACNHVSVLDGPVLAAVTGWHRRRATRFLIASEVFDGFWGFILRQARQIPIKRGRGDLKALETAVEAIRGGGCVGIFPEGRVSHDPSTGLQRIRSGLTRLAIPTDAPVIPVAIWGTQRSWPSPGGPRLRAILRRPALAVVYGSAVQSPPRDAGGSPEDFRGYIRGELMDQTLRARAICSDLPEPGGAGGSGAA
jgi:1-acyl-sn-glycerol-3-phosphate acyltransferase